MEKANPERQTEEDPGPYEYPGPETEAYQVTGVNQDKNPGPEEEFIGQVPTRKALEKELQEAQEQVEKLKNILAQTDEVIELFLGAERYL